MQDETKARALLAAQFVALGMLALPDRGRRRPRSRFARVAGGALILAGGGLSLAGAVALGSDLRPLPIPRPGVTLRHSGPYRFTRHPIYTGLLIGAVGRALSSGSRRHVWASAALAGVFHVKAGFEERLLDDVVPYRQYRSKVPRWGLGK